MNADMKTASGAYKLYIDGKWAENSSGKTFPVYEPATELVMAEVLEADRSDVDRAVQAARRAFDSGAWPAKTPQDRAQILFKLAAKVREQLPMLAEVEAINTGKPIVESEYDILAVAEVFEYYGGLVTKVPGQVNPVSANALSPVLTRADRRLRIDRSMELSFVDGRMEACSRDRRRLHDDPEAR